MNSSNIREWSKNIMAHGGIIVFFIMAFEVMIMISPFAFFFYSVFNPIFHWLNTYPATRWLTHFFLPHMILPPTFILKAIRISGSLLFVIGFLTFIVCALQVYLGKIFKWGIADKGIYRFIRHPQYMALGIWGIGMAILWPRFIVLATLSIMFILYYFLAKAEEKRMTRQYEESYADYMNKTGMFLPITIERHLTLPLKHIRSKSLKYTVVQLTIVMLVIGSGFIFRYITLSSIQYYSKDNITIVSIMPEDNRLTNSVINSISINESASRIKFLNKQNDYLCYLMPVDYIMQGMIANTGSEHKLYKKHHTIALITDWVLYPFEHLRRPPSVNMAKMHNVDPVTARRHHCPLGINNHEMKCNDCSYRRVILVEVNHNLKEHITGEKLLGFNTIRIPVGFIDIDTKTGEIIDARKVDTKTAWEDVPTPAI